MKFTLFYPSLASCWNHGNAHVLRGVCRELHERGHEVSVWEPADGWSPISALQDIGAAALAQPAKPVPGVKAHVYEAKSPDLDVALDGTDVVIVHESNAPELVAAIGARRAAGGSFTLLFHDTRHRAVPAPRELGRIDIAAFDGVLAVGEALREIYLADGWARQVVTWHGAADTALFHPIAGQKKAMDLVWIGNWGDGARSANLHEFLLEPISELGLTARFHGAHYPDDVRAELAARGIDYAGWLPNHQAPLAFAKALMTVHVPRRPDRDTLPGIPTIRMFEALACGIPLVSAPWYDVEGLFPPGCFVSVKDGKEMTAALSLLRRDSDLRDELIRNGLAAIKTRHSCAHRADELLSIVGKLQGRALFRQTQKIVGETLTGAVG